jgi:hypothetical protein
MCTDPRPAGGGSLAACLLGGVRHPRIVHWTEHAEVRAAEADVPASLVEDLVLTDHGRRHANPGSGDWRLRVGRISVIYDHPADGDWLVARIVTVWRR